MKKLICRIFWHKIKVVKNIKNNGAEIICGRCKTKFRVEIS